MILFWALIGALIGVAAAQKKGFSMVGGVLGGLLLGPLAFLMFFITGVSSGEANKKCPYCAEWVKKEAMVCKHCTRDISPRALVQARHAAEAQKSARGAAGGATPPTAGSV